MSDRGLIFIVDDDISSTDALQELLVQDGYAVDSTSTDEDILKAIAAASPNLVLLDTHISDINSFELLEQLK